jgi:hypothetical protein
VAAAWSELRSTMIRQRPPALTRDEWAYLIQFVDKNALIAFAATGRGRERVTLVLPNNVSLLGALVLVVATLSARVIRVKLGSKSDDVVEPFLDFARTHGGPLLREVLAGVETARLSRDDPRLAAWLADADVRVAFGTDAAVAAVAAAPHRADSRFLGFGDMTSEAWLSAGAGDDAIDTLIKVFAIYGATGCTSPRRVIVVDGGPADVRALRDRIAARWPNVLPARVAMHLASQNLLFAQLARHAGADVALAPGHAAVLAITPRDAATTPAGPLTMVLSAATLADAVRALPANAQTIGLALADRADAERVHAALAASPARRVVPLARMHHFEPVWDGQLLSDAFFEAP